MYKGNCQNENSHY